MSDDSLSSESCTDVTVIDPYGHIPIGVNQPQGGSFYPFVDDPGDSPHTEIADLWLSYRDVIGEFVLPFRVLWMNGFGCYEEPPPVAMLHDYDMEIVDANDETVFNTNSMSVEYRETAWTSHQKIIEWTMADRVLRVVHATAWNGNLDPVPQPRYFEPTNAVLDGRAIYRYTPQITKVTVDGEHVTEQELRLVAGYNVKLTPAARPGIRRSTKITIDMTPGQGLGQYDIGCDSVGAPVIRRIAGVAPDAAQNFTIRADGCYTVERQVHDVLQLETTLHPRQVQVSAGLHLTGNCGPCCSCGDYRAVYEATRRLAEDYAALWDRLQASRELYLLNRTRWLDQLACREGSPRLQIAAASYCPCQVGISIAYCNQREVLTYSDIGGEPPTVRGGDECLRNVIIHVSFEYADVENCGVAVSSDPLTAQLVANSVFRGGLLTPGYPRGTDRETYMLHGTYPHYWALLPAVQARGQGFVMFSVEVPECKAGTKLRFVADAYSVPNTSDDQSDGSPVPGYVIGDGPGPESLHYRLVDCPVKKVVVLKDDTCIDHTVRRNTTTDPNSSSGTTTSPNSSSGTTLPGTTTSPDSSVGTTTDSVGTTTPPIGTTTAGDEPGCGCDTSALPDPTAYLVGDIVTVPCITNPLGTTADGTTTSGPTTAAPTTDPNVGTTTDPISDPSPCNCTLDSCFDVDFGPITFQTWVNPSGEYTCFGSTVSGTRRMSLGVVSANAQCAACTWTNAGCAPSSSLENPEFYLVIPKTGPHYLHVEAKTNATAPTLECVAWATYSGVVDCFGSSTFSLVSQSPPASAGIVEFPATVTVTAAPCISPMMLPPGTVLGMPDDDEFDVPFDAPRMAVGEDCCGDCSYILDMVGDVKTWTQLSSSCGPCSNSSSGTTSPNSSSGTTSPPSSSGTTAPNSSSGTTAPNSSSGTTAPNSSSGTTSPGTNRCELCPDTTQVYYMYASAAAVNASCGNCNMYVPSGELGPITLLHHADCEWRSNVITECGMFGNAYWRFRKDVGGIVESSLWLIHDGPQGAVIYTYEGCYPGVMNLSLSTTADACEWPAQVTISDTLP